MKTTELIGIPGIHHHMEALSPEAQQAQLMAELQQLALYRSKKLQKYKDWADPIKRAVIQAKAAADEADARKIASEKLAIDPFIFHSRAAVQMFKLTEIVKPPQPKPKTLWQRLTSWLKGFPFLT